MVRMALGARRGGHWDSFKRQSQGPPHGDTVSIEKAGFSKSVPYAHFCAQPPHTHTTAYYRNKVGTMYRSAEFVDLRWYNTVHVCSVTDLISHPVTCLAIAD